MLKVMIVDDEYMLLRGYRKIIDWNSLGLELAVTEQNPAQALEILRHEPMDILISDMNMPEIDGPTFVAQAKNIRPNMELIVISGYSDFDYVRAGLRQHAVNYLRKPIDTQELVETLRGAIAQIEQRHVQLQNDNLAKQLQVRALLMENSEEKRAKLVQQLQLDFLDPKQIIRLIGVLNPLPPEELADYLNNAANICGYFTRNKDYIILFQGSNIALNNFVNHAPQRVGDSHRPMLIGTAITTPSALPHAYEKLKTEIARQYFFEIPAGLQVLGENEKSNEMPILPGYSEVKKAMSGLDQEAFKNWFLKQLQQLEAAQATDILVRQFALIVLMVLSERLSIMNVKSRAIASINEATVVSKIVQIIMTVFEQTTEDKRKFSHNVLATCRIVEQRYREALSLSSVAEELHLNPVYLGQLFKQDTGRSFSQYLNDYRTNIALDMLHNSNLDVNYIATEVGYQNQSYFYKIFKQQTGMTPLEYREGAGMSS